MTFREKPLRDILGLKPKSSSKNLYDNSDILIEIFSGKSISKIMVQFNYLNRRSFDSAVYQKGVMPLISSKIIHPISENKTGQILLNLNHIEIEDEKWKKIVVLPSIVDALGFRIYSLNVDQSVYNILQDLNSYQYNNIIDFVEISSSSVLKRIKKIDTSKNFIEKDKEEINYWAGEVKKSIEELDRLIRKENHGYQSSETIQGIIKILKRLIIISCDKKMVYCLPNILRRMATCYYHIGAYVDCIAMFDFAIEIAKYSKDLKRQNHIAYTWIASSIKNMLCDNIDYFINDSEKFATIYQLVKNFNRRAFEDYQYSSSEIKIEPLWNLCSLELSLILSCHKMGIKDFIPQTNTACDRLYELIGNIKRKSTNFSGSIRHSIIKDLDANFNDIRHITNMSNDFISLSEQLRTL